MVQPARDWLGVELRHLAALEAIEAERSFRGAAERLGYVQSAVSQQLARLERVVGTRLVDRSSGQSRVELTAAGAVLLHHAREMLGTLSAARADVDALARSGGSVVRLGAFGSVAARVVPQLLARLAALDPDVRVETSEASTDGDLFAAVAAGELDCAFAELPLGDGPFEYVPLMRDPCVLLVHEDSPLAHQERRPTLEEIARLPLAHPTWRMGELIRDRFRAAGLEPPRSFAMETNSAVQALVSAGVAAAIMPRLAVDPDAVGSATIDLSAILPSRTLVLYWHRDRMHGPAFRKVVDVTRTICWGIADRAGRSGRSRDRIGAAVGAA